MAEGLVETGNQFPDILRDTGPNGLGIEPRYTSEAAIKAYQERVGQKGSAGDQVRKIIPRGM